MKRTAIAAGAILTLGVTAGSTAHAQQWLADRSLQEGPGLRAGNFEFHPGLGAEFGYDSNVFYEPVNPTPALRLRVTPSITMSTLGPSRTAQTSEATASPTELPFANFRANLALIWHQYFPITSPDRVSSVSNVGFQAGFRIEVNPGRPFQVNIFDDLARVVQGGPDFGPTVFLYRRIQNIGGIEGVWAPGGGTLDVRLSYINRFSFYEDQSTRYFTNMQNEIALRNRWKFLPKTALLFEASITPTFFFDTSGASTGVSNGYPVRVRFGVNGLLTERLGVLAMVGYFASFYERGDNVNTIIAQAEVKYIFTPVTSFRVGVERNGYPSLLGNWVVRNRAYIGINQTFGGAFYVSAEAAAGYYEFGYIADPTGARDMGAVTGPVDANGRYTAVRLEGTLFGEYRFLPWLAANASLNAGTNISDVQLRTGAVMGGGSPYVSTSWTKIEAFIGLRVSY